MVDIIIPAYNAHKTIKRTLFSILNQNIINKLKIYIVDDCSDENYNREYNFFKEKMDISLIRLDKNMGPGYARQVGVNKSNSKYIMFIDADDVFYDSYAIESILKEIELKNYDLVSGYMIENRKGEILYYLTGTDTLHAKIYKRKFLQNNKIVFPTFYNSEDFAFNIQVFLNKPKYTCVENAIYAYNRRDDSLTGRNYFENKHIKLFCQSVSWAIEKGITANNDTRQIGEIIMYTFSYFYYYFTIRSTMKDKNLKYIFSLLDYYNEYEKYVCDKRKKEIISFYFSYMKIYQFDISFEEFINICIKKQEEKTKC